MKNQVFAKPCKAGDLEDQAQYSSQYLFNDSNSRDTASNEPFADDQLKVMDTAAQGNQKVCRRTSAMVKPFWLIVAGGQLYVTGVTIEPAPAIQTDLQLADFEVRVGEYSNSTEIENNELCYKQQGKVLKEAYQLQGDTRLLPITCRKPLYGSYVIIRGHSALPSTISLCSVKVWGRVCKTVLDATIMHPLTSRPGAKGDSDIWALLSDDSSCFETGEARLL